MGTWKPGLAKGSPIRQLRGEQPRYQRDPQRPEHHQADGRPYAELDHLAGLVVALAEGKGNSRVEWQEEVARHADGDSHRGHHSAHADGSEQRDGDGHEDGDDGRTNGEERVQQIDEREDEQAHGNDIPARQASRHEHLGHSLGRAGLHDHHAQRDDGADDDDDIPRNLLLDFLEIDEVEARQHHEGQRDDGHHSGIENGNEARDNPGDERQDDDNASFDIETVDILCGSRLFANLSEEAVLDGLRLEGQGQEEPRDGHHDSSDGQPDGHPLEEGDASAGSLLHGRDGQDVEVAAYRSGHTADDRRHRDAYHEALAQVGMSRIGIGCLQNGEGEAVEDNGHAEVGKHR